MITKRGLARTAGLLMLAAAGLVAMPSPASADTTLEITTPADGYAQIGSPTPLLVTIESDRAVTGTLTATFDGNFGGSQLVEVPGGSAKEVLFLVSTPPWGSSGQVSFDSGNKGDDGSARITLKSPGTDEIVGVLPSLTSGREVPASAELAIEIGVARLFPLDPALLASGAEVLSPFSQIIGTSADLEAMDDDQLDAVRAWVATYGGTLILDDAPGTTTPLELDPAGLDPAGDNRFGVGRVRFTDGVAGTGGYDGLLGPTASRAADEFPFGIGQFGVAPTTILLAADAGVRIPAIGSLVGVLALYVLAAGPVLWLILRRTRRETFLWAALPALALGTTLAVYGIGRALRAETSSAHATVVADLPATRIVSTQVLVTSPSGGRSGVVLPDTWRPVSTISDEMFFGIQPGRPQTGTQRLDGGDLVLDLPSGGVGVVSAESTLPAAEPSWQFDLSPTEGGLEGTVTNLTEHTLQQIYVTSGQGFFSINELAPGESADVKLQDTDRPVITSDRFMERLMGGDPWAPNDGVVNPGVLTNWLARRPALRAPGYVLAVGWTRDESAPLQALGDREVSNGRTAYLTSQAVDTGAGADPGRLELLRGMSTRVLDDVPPGACADQATTVRIIPGLTAGDDPVLQVPTRAISALDLWDGDSWLPTGLSEVGPGQEVILSLPDGALADGGLYARIQLSCDFWSVADPFPLLRAGTATDEVIDPATAAAEGEGDGEA